MAYPRRHLNATMLPTGEVLVTSGTRGTSFDDPSLAVHVAEIWNPDDRGLAPGGEQQREPVVPLDVAPHARRPGPARRQRQRDDDERLPAPDQKNAEYYSPPYLFQGARPSISSAPNPISYGTSFTVAHSERERHHQGQPHRSGLRHPRVRHGPAVHVADVQPDLERPHGQGAHQPEHRAPGLLHAVHPDLERGAVEGQNHQAALSHRQPANGGVRTKTEATRNGLR